MMSLQGHGGVGTYVAPAAGRMGSYYQFQMCWYFGNSGLSSWKQSLAQKSVAQRSDCLYVIHDVI